MVGVTFVPNFVVDTVFAGNVVYDTLPTIRLQEGVASFGFMTLPGFVLTVIVVVVVIMDCVIIVVVRRSL